MPDDASTAALSGGFTVPYPLNENAIKGADGKMSVRVGFRTIRLVQNPLPGGKSYFFEVSGIPIPVKGSNWIPASADAFESRISRNDQGSTRLEPLFWALKDSHQNMIRNVNWGGGIYQRDSFYDLADENGILILGRSDVCVRRLPSAPSLLGVSGQRDQRQRAAAASAPEHCTVGTGQATSAGKRNTTRLESLVTQILGVRRAELTWLLTI